MNLTAVLEHRIRLIAQMYRITGVWADAEDCVDEALARLVAHSDAPAIEDPVAWVAVAAGRLALDRLRRRQREEYIGPWIPEPVDIDAFADDAVIRADEVRQAVLFAYEHLAPHERAALILREAFVIPYSTLGPALDVAPATARQWVRRARARLADTAKPPARPTPEHVGPLVTAIVAGDLETVTNLLAAEVRIVADGGGQVNAARRPIIGRRKCSYFLVKSTQHQHVEMAATRASGEDALAIRSNGVVRVITMGTTDDGIAQLLFQCNPDKLRHISLPDGWRYR